MKRYRIISELGKGATGVVFRAVRSEDGSTVALKKLVLPGHLDAHEEEEFVRRFKTEAKAAQTLNHPGIVKALDCGLDEGTLYIAYELIEGVTIEEAIKSDSSFSSEEVADIIMQIADALDYAHREGVVHRDLSPGNIFLTSDGKVRITDFGVAGFTSRATITPGDDSIVGTPGYMAPEQITGGETDPKSDIFALGCVAYELLTGSRAFTGDNIAQIIHRIINEQPSPIRELNHKVPLALEEIVFRMLAKNSDYRYQSMQEVRLAAERVIGEIPKISKKMKEQEAGHAPVLVVTGGPHDGERFNLQQTVTTIGRMIGDVLLAGDEKVAGQHAWITKEESGWILYDADTENGTFLNGERIERDEIFAGDKIRIGDTVLEFQGAGGHVGAFEEPGDTGIEPDVHSSRKIPSEAKRVPLGAIVLLVIPGIIVLAGLLYIGVVKPQQIMSSLNDVTNERWVTAFDHLDTTAIGTPAWLQAAFEINQEWRQMPIFEIDPEPDTDPDSTVSGPGDFMAPVWVIGHGRINTEVDFRFDMFAYATEFLTAVTPGTSGWDGTENSAGLTLAVQTVRGIKLRIENMDVPAGVSPEWTGRRNQLISVIRRWEAAAVSGMGSDRTSGFTAERNRANQSLLNGWYTYEESNGDLMLLDDAFNQFQSCIETMDPILEVNPGEEEASAVRGLAYYLCARVLRDAGASLGPDRYERALNYLDSAQTDISSIGNAAWNRAIPDDFDMEFQSPETVQAKIRALRLTLNSLLSEE